MDIEQHVIPKVRAAKVASRLLATLGTDRKNKLLSDIADQLLEQRSQIKAANAKDMAAGKANKLSSALMDRLELNDARIAAMATGLHQVATLQDPVGEVLGMVRRPNGLRIGQVRTPLGVIGIIYESRPNVTIDTIGLCLKSGNAIILRGGKEAIHSNLLLAELARSCLPSELRDCVQIIETTDRAAVDILLRQDKYVDIIVPRGGEGLIRRVKEYSSIPVICHDKGLCHTYIHQDANLEMAVSIAMNAKVDRPGVCNAMETLLVDHQIAPAFLGKIVPQLINAGVELRGCAKTCALVPNMAKAEPIDWDTEYHDLILSIKVVEDIEAAIAHITAHGSMHSEAIVTNNYTASQQFLSEVDAAAVYVNASTRFTDGFEFGLGAEVGISTQKLHVRGPMGMEGLTSTKYIIYGEGQIK